MLLTLLILIYECFTGKIFSTKNERCSMKKTFDDIGPILNNICDKKFSPLITSPQTKESPLILGEDNTGSINGNDYFFVEKKIN